MRRSGLRFQCEIWALAWLDYILLLANMVLSLPVFGVSVRFDHICGWIMQLELNHVVFYAPSIGQFLRLWGEALLEPTPNPAHLTFGLLNAKLL